MLQERRQIAETIFKDYDLWFQFVYEQFVTTLRENATLLQNALDSSEVAEHPQIEHKFKLREEKDFAWIYFEWVGNGPQEFSKRFWDSKDLYAIMMKKAFAGCMHLID